MDGNRRARKTYKKDIYEEKKDASKDPAQNGSIKKKDIRKMAIAKKSKRDRRRALQQILLARTKVLQGTLESLEQEEKEFFSKDIVTFYN